MVNGTPVAREETLSAEIRKFLLEKCNYSNKQLLITFPDGIPHKGLGFYNTRSGGYFSEVIKTKVSYSGIDSVVDIRFEIYVSKDKIKIEAIDSIKIEEYNCSNLSR